LEPAIRELPHIRKFGAEFAMGNDTEILNIDFADGYCDGKETINIERCIFDAMLLREAKKAGAEIRQPVGVREILKLSDGDVQVSTDVGVIRGRYLLDASGQATVVGRHLKTRQNATEPHLRKIAYFNPFQQVERPPGIKEGHPLIAMVEEGWFWMISINEKTTSVGMVLDAESAKRIMEKEKIEPDRMLAWGIARCPIVANRMRAAVGSGKNGVTADFSYRCRPYAGDGYFLIGDAATFMDPIFSTGVAIAADGGTQVAMHLDNILAGNISPARARETYISRMEESTRTLFQLIRQYYDHSFRELFLTGRGPLQVHRAVIGVLAGNVFPRPPWKLRWRLRLFDYLVRLNRKKPLVPQRDHFSLIGAMA
jgi:flavin-dependent dehydrogenase